MSKMLDREFMCEIPDEIINAAILLGRYMKEHNAYYDITSSICGMGHVHLRDEEIARLKEKLTRVEQALK